MSDSQPGEHCSPDNSSVYWSIRPSSQKQTYPYPILGVDQMTIDKSLKVRRGGTGNRSVLTRGERLEKLKETDRWQEGD